MEAKLKQYADLLPQPRRDFPQMAEFRTSAGSVPRRGLRLAVLALVLCLTITACTRAAVSYGLWSGIHSSGYGDVKILSLKYDYEFPEILWELSFDSMSTYYGAPQGATHLEALLSPTYALHSVNYGDYSREEQIDGTIIWTGKQIGISFGTTEKETWKYHFSVAEDGSCNYADVKPDSQSSLEYEGYTLYLYTVSYPSVRWEDPEKQLVIDITLYGSEYAGEVVDIAKTLIDRNMD